MTRDEVVLRERIAREIMAYQVKNAAHMPLQERSGMYRAAQIARGGRRGTMQFYYGEQAEEYSWEQECDECGYLNGPLEALLDPSENFDWECEECGETNCTNQGDIY